MTAGAAVTSTDATGVLPGTGQFEEPLLRLREVTKRYADGTVAVDGVSLDVRPGELVSVVGPSGCGKSTLLRVVAGLTSASSGELAVREQDVGFVFQDATLLPWRTVLGNLELPGVLAGVPKAERRRRALEALELTGLSGFERHLPRRLSGGMRMRVSLARELTTHPRVFLLDEPFAALDEITRQRLDDELLRLFGVERFGGIFVTHSVAEAAYLSSRVLVMSARPGRFVAEVPVRLPYPRTPDVRFDPRFVRVTEEISARLKEAS